ncbi:Arginase/deacetylase [Coemansia reversa NRRL 1564]|uniref:Histone deacetylase n=1 Tax=Coemansia reversa (strain ATCC 12441 / NRRL 1564) TaxID=763665 RepID=A0A2G5B7D0_COERN|nr:Arginase/deacetylase [Coemansia reversa NRRL 1564]|eukprot:PIA14909.1 Arginase/deacetylase [Coemansia reversa NRRL 1564]
MDQARQVTLVRSAQSIQAADRLPSNKGRASRVHALIDAFGLNTHMEIVAPEPMPDSSLMEFHSEEYIACLFAAANGTCLSHTSQDYDKDNGIDEELELEQFGLVHDCAVFSGMEEHVRYAAGGTVAGANALVRGSTDVAIHWEGGRHHCRRGKAAGFCYINDVVLGILALQTRFRRILYVDFDLHHGDGVQSAFQYSDRVMTLSIHHHDRGFYPNSGGSYDEGKGRGIGHSINIPLRRGADDDTFLRVFSAVSTSILATFAPLAVAVQCGCDGLAGDPHKVFNLTTEAFARSVKTVLGWRLPTLLLGGGGYNLPDSARCWTRLTGVACGRDIPAAADVPGHRFLDEYSPAFDMATDATSMFNANDGETIDAAALAIKHILESQSR